MGDNQEYITRNDMQSAYNLLDAAGLKPSKKITVSELITAANQVYYNEPKTIKLEKIK